MSTIDDYRKALKALMMNEHISLGDLVYSVREREGLGWDGPSVKQWSKAVLEAERLLREDAACK